jgi:hypothetical protein
LPAGDLRCVSDTKGPDNLSAVAEVEDVTTVFSARKTNVNTLGTTFMPSTWVSVRYRLARAERVILKDISVPVIGWAAISVVSGNKSVDRTVSGSEHALPMVKNGSLGCF